MTLDGAPAALTDQVITGNYYQINLMMIKAIFSTEEDFDLTVFEQRNYAAINESGYSAVINYIHDNINEYITEVYLKLPSNIHEEEEELLLLVNNSEIAVTSRIEIIGRCETVLNNLKEVEEIELDPYIFGAGKIKVAWENVILYFQRQGDIDETLANYVSRVDIAQALGEVRVPTNSPVVDLETTNSFILKLINRNQIEDNPYQVLTKAIPYKYDLSDIVGLGRLKLAALINNMQISFSEENLVGIRLSYPGLQHRYIESFALDFISQIDMLTLTADEVNNILLSEIFHEDQKQIVIDHVGDQMITDNQDLQNSLIPLIMCENPLRVSKDILVCLLQVDQAIGKRIKLFNMYNRNFGPEDTKQIFKNFPKPYNKIGEKFTSPVLDNATEEDILLAINLKDQKMISNFKVDQKKIKIINFKWK